MDTKGFLDIPGFEGYYMVHKDTLEVCRIICTADCTTERENIIDWKYDDRKKCWYIKLSLRGKCYQFHHSTLLRNVFFEGKHGRIKFIDGDEKNFCRNNLEFTPLKSGEPKPKLKCEDVDRRELEGISKRNLLDIPGFGSYKIHKETLKVYAVRHTRSCDFEILNEVKHYYNKNSGNRTIDLSRQKKKRRVVTMSHIIRSVFFDGKEGSVRFIDGDKDNFCRSNIMFRPKTVLSEDDKKYIVKELKSGKNANAIAKSLGMYNVYIYNFLKQQNK